MQIYRVPGEFPDLTSVGGAVYASKGEFAVTAPGTSGQVLQSNGSAAPSWVSPGGGIGTVTSVALTVPTGLTVAGSPITSAGTLAVSLTGGAVIPVPSALTKTDDTNVTLTLGGSPSTALINATSLTLGWTGQLGLTRGGTAASLTAINGGAVYSTASALAVTAAGTSGQVLTSNGAAAPTWQTPSSVTPAALTRTDDTNVTLTLGGTPSTALLQATSITAGWTGQLSVGRGGTGLGSYTTGDLLYASGSTTLAGLADVATGQVLVSGGTGTAPAYSATPTVTTLTAGGARNLVVTSTDGVPVTNTTAATLAVPVQISPRVRLSGTGWDTDDTTSRTVSFFWEVLPSSGTTVAGSLKLGYINPVSAAITYPFTIANNGVITAAGTFIGSDGVYGGSSGAVGWASRSEMKSPANAQINLLNNANSSGVGFDISTDSTLKIRTRAQTGDGSITLLNSGYTGYSQMTEMTAPGGGAANTVRIYAEDNGAGKTRLMAIFNTGAAQQIAIEP